MQNCYRKIGKNPKRGRRVRRWLTLQRVRNKAQYDKDRKTSDKAYDNKEERRVITGREQKVARALGEIKKGQVTRKNHLGLNVTTPGPTSNKYDKPTKKQEQEIIEKLKSK